MYGIAKRVRCYKGSLNIFLNLLAQLSLANGNRNKRNSYVWKQLPYVTAIYTMS